MAAIFAFRHTRTYDSIPSCLYLLSDPGNMGVAEGIFSLLSCLRAEINAFSYILPVNGRHLCFTTYPDIEQQHLLNQLLSINLAPFPP